MLGVEAFLERGEHVILDVRTPAEYASGHIPKARNLPLFSNEERAVVGTIYKQESPEAAFIKGLDFAGLKMATYVETAIELAPARQVSIHCWRGGKRSGSLAWLLEFAGFQVNVLEGGYKAYRRAIRESNRWSELKLIVLGGPTGSGKTQILHQLAASGEQIIDLEGLAHHRGSAFGAIGQVEQSSIEQFENNLHEVVSKLDLQRRVWVENESRTIGKIYLPDYYWEVFENAFFIELEVSFEQRVERLVHEYACFPVKMLEESFLKIRKRLGHLECSKALEALANQDFSTAAVIALRYYDKSYRISTDRTGFEKRIKLIAQTDVQSSVQRLIQQANEQGL